MRLTGTAHRFGQSTARPRACLAGLAGAPGPLDVAQIIAPAPDTRRSPTLRGMTQPPALQQVMAEYGVRFAYLFGSRATGRHRPDSDADVAVMTSAPLSLLTQAALADRLSDLLGVPAVDLVDLERAPLTLRGRIVQERQVLYSVDEPGRVEFEVRTRSEYFDFLPTHERHRRRFLERVAAGGLDGRP